MVRPELEARGLEVHLVSSATHEGLRDLLFAMAKVVSDARMALGTPEPTRVVIRPTPVDDAGFSVQREQTSDGELYRVRGVKPERWVRQTDFSNDEAVGYLADRLARLGVEDALVGAGAMAGAEVVIGGADGVIFDWEPTLLAGAAAPAAPRGSDLRLEETARPTRDARREQYELMRVARRDARAELATERGAGHWVDPADGFDEPSGDVPSGDVLSDEKLPDDRLPDVGSPAAGPAENELPGEQRLDQHDDHDDAVDHD
jgi:GTP-binding protein